MKNLRSITKNEARQILNDNNEYIVWANNIPIETEEIIKEFGLTQYENQPDGCMNLEHKTQDFRIEDIIF